MLSQRVSMVAMIAAVTLAGSALAQSSLVEWFDVHGYPAPGEVPPGEGEAPSGIEGVTFYTVRGDWDLAAPGLPCEDFEEGLGIPGVVGAPAPLNASTSNPYFSPGEILPGIEFRDNPLNGGKDGLGLAYVAAGFAGNPSITVVANTFVDMYEIVFSPPVTSAGMDLQSFFTGASLEIRMYDASDIQFGLANGTSSPAGTFWGFVSTTPVGRLTFLHPAVSGDGAEGVDNICFGDGAPAPSLLAIPTLSGVGLASLAALTLLAAVLLLRRRA